MTLLPDGTVDHANPEALSLLGVTLSQLRALPPGAFSPEAPDPEAQAAFREQWEAGGRPDVGGDATLRRLDGSMVRVRFAIAAQPDGRYVAVLAPTRGSTNAPSTLFTGGRILAEWRAAERQLAELRPDSPEAVGVRTEIERLRELYQDLFRG